MTINNSTSNTTNTPPIEKKKRGRKKLDKTNVQQNTIISSINNHNNDNLPKKRGRKPKGGKIINNSDIKKNNTDVLKPNIILHLKCTINDINNVIDPTTYNPNSIVNSVEPYNNSNLIYEKLNTCGESNFEIIDNPNNNNNTIKPDNKINKNKEIWNKLILLSNNLHTNDIPDKKCNCFWCTEHFDGPNIYLPRNKVNDTYQVYGCFCSPECATAYLFSQNIDTSTKFERYHMLNNIYNKVFNYTKNIKPAPSPFYLLNKYYGNLSIDEYRKLFDNERILLVVDKPMTRIYPELFEENNEYQIQNLHDNPNKNNKYRLSINKSNTNNKTDLINQNFGFT